MATVSGSGPGAGPARTASGAVTSARFASLGEHVPWIALALLAVGGAYAYYGSMATAPLLFRDRGQAILGWLAAAGFLTAYVYAARRRLGLGRFRRIRPFYLAHIWLTGGGLLIAALHADLQLAGGPIEQMLLVGFGIVVLSGCGFALYHRFLAAWTVKMAGEHHLLEDITGARADLANQTAELLTGGRGPLSSLVHRRILRRLAHRRIHWQLLRGPAGHKALVDEFRADLAANTQKLKKDEKAIVDRILEGELAARKLEVQAELQQMRRWWFGAHAVLAAAVLALLVVHVALVWYY